MLVSSQSYHGNRQPHHCLPWRRRWQPAEPGAGTPSGAARLTSPPTSPALVSWALPPSRRCDGHPGQPQEACGPGTALRRVCRAQVPWEGPCWSHVMPSVGEWRGGSEHGSASILGGWGLGMPPAPGKVASSIPWQGQPCCCQAPTVPNGPRLLVRGASPMWEGLGGAASLPPQQCLMSPAWRSLGAALGAGAWCPSCSTERGPRW